VLPCRQVAHHEEAVEAQQAEDHEEEHSNDEQADHEQRARVHDRDAMHTFAEKDCELCTLEGQEPHEDHAVVLPDACTNPWAMMIVGSNTTLTIAAMLCPQRLVQPAVAAPPQLMAALHLYLLIIWPAAAPSLLDTCNITSGPCRQLRALQRYLLFHVCFFHRGLHLLGISDALILPLHCAAATAATAAATQAYAPKIPRLLWAACMAHGKPARIGERRAQVAAQRGEHEEPDRALPPALNVLQPRSVADDISDEQPVNRQDQGWRKDALCAADVPEGAKVSCPGLAGHRGCRSGFNDGCSTRPHGEAITGCV